MTILAQDLINDIAAELSDETFVTWTVPELLSYLNSATRRISLVRPDASSVVKTVQLVAGTKQALVTGDRRLLNVVRNMGDDGVTPGKTITSTDMRSMDLYNPSWHKDTAKTSIDHFMYDEETPDTFFVTPPVHATTQVHIEIKVAQNPTVLTDAETENLPINDVYEPAVRHWMLHRAYDKETDSPHSVRESRFHFQAFHDLLGIKVKVDVNYSPSREVKGDKP